MTTQHGSPVDHEEVDRKVQITSDTADTMLRQNQRTNTLFVRIVAVWGALLLVAVTTFGVISVHKQDGQHTQTISLLNGHSAEIKTETQILKQVLMVTSPPNIAKERAASAENTAHAILCEDNHGDISTAIIHHLKPVKLLKGCPYDPNVGK